MSGTVTETCTVRPELMEFQKTATEYLSIVAYPSDGFKFTKTMTTTADAGDVTTDLYYDTANLADLYANTIFAERLEVDTISNVSRIFMVEDGTGVIDMNNGNIIDVGLLETTAGVANSVRIHDNIVDLNETGDITNVREMTFFEEGATSVLTFRNDAIMFGESNGIIDMNDGNIEDVQHMSLVNAGTINAREGTMYDLALLDMSEEGVVNMHGGLVDFGPTGGRIEMVGLNARANIGSLNISTNAIVNVNPGGIVKVEDTEFEGNIIYTRNIQRLAGETAVTVVHAEFTDDYITVGNVSTDMVTVKSTDPNANLVLQAGSGPASTIRVERRDSPGTIRITNVATPVADSDAATKGYVKEAVEQNIQGLKPKKACDVSMFAGDWANNTFSTQTSAVNKKYFMTHKPAYDANVGDISELFLFYTSENDNFTVDGRVFTREELNLSHWAELNNISPSVPRLRILVNGLNAESFRPEATMNDATINTEATLSGNVGSMMDNANVAGLNGIWEIANQLDGDNNGVGTVQEHAYNIFSTNYFCIRLQRSMDMNQNHEVMNGAYVYIKEGTSTRSNMAYVVSNNDPLTISQTTGLTQANWYDTPADEANLDGVLAMKELEWVDFNSVNYELAYVNTTGVAPEFDQLAAEFQKGGLAMKYDPYDDKKIMVDSTMIRYESNETNGLSLHVKGNIDFDLQDTDAYISSNATKKVLVNASEFTRNDVDGTSSMYTDFIVCNTATCESDRTLKKNISTIVNGLELVSKLNAVTFNWNTDENAESTEYGFIAQEVEAEFPSLVRTDKSTGIKSVDYQKITSMLASAVQQLAARL